MIRVLFVCLGNICRSPMAEAVFRKMLLDEELSNQIKVDSAGTGSWHTGKQPHEGTRDILDRYEISYKGINARQIAQEDWDKFNYIIAMDDQNMKDIESTFENKNSVIVKKLTDFIDDQQVTHVPDPYYTGDFDYTYKLVYEGSKNLLMYIKENHNI